MWAVRVVLSQVGFLIFLLITGIYLYFFHHNPPFEVYSAQTDKESYTAGESMRVSVDGNIRAQAPSVTEFHLRDTVEYSLTTLRSSAAPEGLIKADLPRFLIPLTIVPGNYYIHAESRFKVNFLATRVVEWRTNSFMVAPPPPPEPVAPVVQIVEVPVYVPQIVEIPVYIYVPVSDTVPAVELVELPPAPAPVVLIPSPVTTEPSPKLNGVSPVVPEPEPEDDPAPAIVSPPPAPVPPPLAPPPPAPIPAPPTVPPSPPAPPPAPIPAPPLDPPPVPNPVVEPPSRREGRPSTQDDCEQAVSADERGRRGDREERKEEKHEEKKERHEERNEKREDHGRKK